MQERVESVNETGQSLSLQEYGDMFRRRRLVIFQVFAFVLVVGVLITMVQAPTYRAVARLLVSPPSYVINNVSTDPLAALFQLSQQYSPLTQVEMIQRSEIKDEVGRRLNAKSLPIVSVDVVENTSIIEVTVEGDNPSLVRDTANTLVDVYTENVKTKGESSLRQASQFASDQARVNNEDAVKALSELQTLKKDKNLPDLQSNREAQQQVVTDLQIAYNTARAASIEAQRKIESSRDRLKSIPTTKSDIPSPDADPTVQSLQVKIDELETELTSLGTTLGPSSDSIVVKTKQLAELRERLVKYRKSTPVRTARFNPAYATLNERIIQLEIDASAAATRAAGIATSLKTAEARLNQFPLWENYYQRL
ncbi:MAG: GumC family protein, partial [Armatimonadaceae bacterium]